MYVMLLVHECDNKLRKHSPISATKWSAGFYLYPSAITVLTGLLAEKDELSAYF